MIILRLKKVGSKNRSTYRIVAAEKRSKSCGKYSELIGHYNPLVKPPVIKIDQVKFDKWIKNGAQISSGLKKIISQ